MADCRKFDARGFMHEVQILKVVTDVALVFSLIYLALRWNRPQSRSAIPGRMPELEASLRALIQEADESSRALHEKLIKRQSALEKLTFDLETMEHRLNRTITTAEEAKGLLELERSRIQGVIQEVAMIHGTGRAPEIAEPLRQSSLNQSVEKTVISRQTRPVEDKQVEDQVSAAQIEDDTPKWSNVNIYGEPIAAPAATEALSEPKPVPPPSMAAKAYQPLKPEVQIQKRPMVDETRHPLTEVYDAAEELLKAGRDLKSVAAATNLPIDEVRLLSQMVAQEAGTRDMSRVEIPDDRLGVLASMRRQTRTL